jgi:hypothetical protein
MAAAGSPRPPLLRGWWRRWPSWSPRAAMAWSASYGTLALGWALGAPGFPFGEHDPEGAAMGSVLFAARAEPTGLVMAGCCVVGVIVWRVLNQAVIVLGGVLWAMTASSYRRRNPSAGAGGGEVTAAADRRRTLLRWGRPPPTPPPRRRCHTASPGWPGPSASHSASTRTSRAPP